jgi:hypothetical protein
VSGHVFISYARADLAYVEKLAAHLRAAGIDPWYDHEMVSGDRFDDVIEQKIETAAAVIAVLTPESVSSRWVRREFHFAVENDIPVHPLMLHTCRPPLILAGIHREDVTSGALPGEAFLRRITHLTAAGFKDHAVRPHDAPYPELSGVRVGSESLDIIRIVGRHFRESLTSQDERVGIDVGSVAIPTLSCWPFPISIP